MTTHWQWAEEEDRTSHDCMCTGVLGDRRSV